MTGVVNSTVMSGIRDAVEKARVPLIGSNASPTSLQSVVYIWRTSYVLDEPGRALGSYLRRTLPAGSRLAIIAPEGPASLDVIQGFRDGFGADDPRIGDPIFTTANPNPGKNAYGAEISKALSRQPDGVFCFYSGTAACSSSGNCASRWLGADLRARLPHRGQLLTDLRLEPEPDALKAGIQTSLNYSADLNNNANRLFASAYRKTLNASPTTYAMASYDAAQVLDKAIRLAGARPDPAAGQPGAGQDRPDRQPARRLAVQPAAYPAAEVVPAQGPVRRPAALQRPDQRDRHARLSAADGGADLPAGAGPCVRVRVRSVPQLGDAALDAAAALLQLGQLHRHRVVAGRRQLAGQPGGLAVEHHVAPVADQVEAERQRVLVVGEHRVREELGEHPLAGRGEGAREVDDVAVVDRGQRHVQVVEARVDQAQRHHRAAEHLLRLGVRGQLGAEAVPGEDQPAVRLRQVREVALALVGLARRDEPPALRLVEGPVRGGLGGPLLVLEPRAVDDVPSTTKAPLAAKTMSGRPGSG